MAVAVWSFPWAARSAALDEYCYGNVSLLAAVNTSHRTVLRAATDAHPEQLDAGVCATDAASSDRHPRCLPSVIVVGGQKCGTTTFDQMASVHPWIAHSFEPHYFDRDYHHPLDANRPWWHRANDTWWEYAKHWTDDGRVAWEKTPYDYALRGFGLLEMRELLPSVKIILLLREPGARAYSHFNFALHGRVYAGEAFQGALPLTLVFDAAVRGEGALRSTFLYDGVFGFLGAGIYSRRLALMKVLGFGCDRSAVIVSERFFANPQACASQAHGPPA